MFFPVKDVKNKQLSRMTYFRITASGITGTSVPELSASQQRMKVFLSRHEQFYVSIVQFAGPWALCMRAADGDRRPVCAHVKHDKFDNRFATDVLTQAGGGCKRRCIVNINFRPSEFRQFWSLDGRTSSYFDGVVVFLRNLTTTRVPEVKS